MNGEQSQAESLVLGDQMADVGAREAAAGRAVAVASSGRASRAKRAFFRFSARSQVSAEPVRPSRVGSTQSNMSMPARDHREDALGVADAHEVARPLGGQQRRRPGRSTSNIAPALLADARGRRARSRRSRASVISSIERRRSSRSTPPCAMPKQQLAGARRGAATLARRPARRALDRRPRAPRAVAPAGGHSSRAIAMSEPSAAWIARACSGVKRASLPS